MSNIISWKILRTVAPHTYMRTFAFLLHFTDFDVLNILSYMWITLSFISLVYFSLEKHARLHILRKQKRISNKSKRHNLITSNAIGRIRIAFPVSRTWMKERSLTHTQTTMFLELLFYRNTSYHNNEERIGLPRSRTGKEDEEVPNGNWWN